MSIRIDDALTQQVRDRNDIVQVVGDYVSLRKAGGSYKGLCPFHDERTPSFNVHQDRQFFYCFGCQTGGDVISFVRELHGYGFIEAVRHLAERGGVALPEARGDAQHSGAASARRRKAKQGLHEVSREAQAFFRQTLQHVQGGPCRDYIRARGLEAEIVKRFGLGFAPNAWDGLLDHLVRRGVSVERAEEAGLVTPRKSGTGHYDRFRNRLMFPIRDLAGEVIAFGGRILPSDEEEGDDKAPKYINSPETPIYDKGRTLYGLHEARRAIRDAGEAVVVEGNVDVLMVAQVGVERVVAPMGTALTPDQCRRLKRMAERAVLLYDGDEAGQAAALKAVPAALAEGLRVAVATLPPGEDPDSYARAHGREGLEALLAGATAGWDYVVEHTLEALRFDEDPRTATPRAVDRLAPVLESIADRRERLLHMRNLAQRLGLDDRDLGDFLREATRQRRPAPMPGAPAPPPRRPPVPAIDPEINLLALLLLHPDARLLYQARDCRRLVSSEEVCEAIARLLPDMDEEEPRGLQPAAFLAELEEPHLKEQLARKLQEPWAEADWKAQFEKVVGELMVRDIKRQRGAVNRVSRGSDGEAELLRAIGEQRRREQQREQIKGS